MSGITQRKKKKKQPQKTEEMKLSKFKKNTQNQRM